MVTKNIQSRVIHKHDIEANWIKAVNFIPQCGEIIVYDIDDNYTYERFKIGDGIQNVNNLPFLNAIQSDWKQTDETAMDFIKNKPSSEDALIAATETGLIDPIVDKENMAILMNENGNVLIF